MAKKIKQAVILAGGLGTRLRPLTNDRPKPMVLLNGKPFLEHIVGFLKENGIERIVLLLGYLPEKVTEYFGDGSRFGVEIAYSIGTVDDETGTRIRNAAHLLDPEFILLYGDNYWALDLGAMGDAFFANGSTAMLTGYANTAGDGEYGRLNNLRIEPEGRVSYYGPASEDPSFNAIEIGIYFLKREVLGMMPEENFSFQNVVLPKLIASGDLTGYMTYHPYYPITKPDLIPTTEEFLRPRKVIFLDRDGVINKQMPPHEHVRSWKDFSFLPGALEGIRWLTEHDYEIYVVTNQRGIANGSMTEKDLADIHQKMLAEVERHGGKIAAIYHCPHEIADDCDCRKPKAGMFFRAAREHRINLRKSVLIGDSESDRHAGVAAGCETIVIMPSGGSLLEVVKSLS